MNSRKPKGIENINTKTAQEVNKLSFFLQKKEERSPTRTVPHDKTMSTSALSPTTLRMYARQQKMQQGEGSTWRLESKEEGHVLVHNVTQKISKATGQYCFVIKPKSKNDPSPELTLGKSSHYLAANPKLPVTINEKDEVNLVESKNEELTNAYLAGEIKFDDNGTIKEVNDQSGGYHFSFIYNKKIGEPLFDNENQFKHFRSLLLIIRAVNLPLGKVHFYNAGNVIVRSKIDQVVANLPSEKENDISFLKEEIIIREKGLVKSTSEQTHLPTKSFLVPEKLELAVELSPKEKSPTGLLSRHVRSRSS